MKPLVSIIIVNFNAGRDLLACLQSVFAIDLPLEVIVVDNASTDNSITLVEQHYSNEQRLHLIRNSANLGFSKANNLALDKLQGNYWLFLNPDCLIEKNVLLRMMVVMEENPTAGMAGCLIKNMDETIQPTCVRRLPNLRNAFVRALRLDKWLSNKSVESMDIATNKLLPTQVAPVEAISGAFMFVRPSALATVGPLDERFFLYGEDIDWMWRFQQHHWQILFVPDVAIYHAKGVCGRKRPYRVLWRKHQAMILFFNKHFKSQYHWSLRILVYMAIVGRLGSLLLLASMKNFIRSIKFKKTADIN